jgi:predicted DNA binding CopG/RHH family protein
MSKPKFKSDEEFANWVESAEGRALIHKQYEEAKRKGTARRELPDKVAAILSRKPQTAVSIHLRVPANDLEKARSIAERKGIGYQTWLKMAIHEAVERETDRG